MGPDLTRIRQILCDVDGVLTSGRIMVGRDGEVTKGFHVRDGHRIRQALASGLGVGIVSGRCDPCVRARAQDLGLDPILLVSGPKAPAAAAWLAEHGLAWAETAFVGDDLNDLDCLDAAGLSVAVGDAAPAVRRRVDLVTRNVGGRGAVAELIDMLLASRPAAGSG